MFLVVSDCHSFKYKVCTQSEDLGSRLIKLTDKVEVHYRLPVKVELCRICLEN